ncbi:hypothetical protein, partial [Chlorobium phaeovibrioides]|uniref:hypothetical protein n=1 Tax=Chlorobium phaeovibrioides TaxID=1094 RepID=UPI001F1A9D34
GPSPPHPITKLKLQTAAAAQQQPSAFTQSTPHTTTPKDRSTTAPPDGQARRRTPRAPNHGTLP